MRDTTKVMAALLIAGAAACGGDAGSEGGAEGGAALSGRIQIDGSSTVYPVSQAMAEEFMRSAGRDVRVTVSQSGTGGGFQRFCAGETEISDASRPIKAEERELCQQNGVEPIELEVAVVGSHPGMHTRRGEVEARCVGIGQEGLVVLGLGVPDPAVDVVREVDLVLEVDRRAHAGDERVVMADAELPELEGGLRGNHGRCATPVGARVCGCARADQERA